MRKFIPISKPCLGKREMGGVKKVLESGMLVQGKHVEDFEKAFSNFTDTKYAIAVNSGTSALMCALLVHSIRAGDEVITTPLSFIATASSIMFCGAKPVFVDIGDDFNMDADLIEEKITGKTKAIMPVHLFGKPCDMKKILELCQDHKITLIEDACQAHGASYLGKKVGSFGTGCFSFYATKNMTTSEGGMITTNRRDTYEKIKMLRNIGMKKQYDYRMLGFNMRMTEMQAILGKIQLSRLPGFIEKRRRNASYLSKKLENIEGIKTPHISEGHVFNQYTIMVEEGFGETRDELKKMLEKKGIQTRVYYPAPLHRIPFLHSRDRLPNAERISKKVLSLPIHPSLTRKELDYITECIGDRND